MTDVGEFIRHMKELSLMVEVMNDIVFGNALGAEMEKPRNDYLVEKIVMNSATARNVIHWNMLQI